MAPAAIGREAAPSAPQAPSVHSLCGELVSTMGLAARGAQASSIFPDWSQRPLSARSLPRKFLFIFASNRKLSIQLLRNRNRSQMSLLVQRQPTPRVNSHTVPDLIIWTVSQVHIIHATHCTTNVLAPITPNYANVCIIQNVNAFSAPPYVYCASTAGRACSSASAEAVLLGFFSFFLAFLRSSRSCFSFSCARSSSSSITLSSLSLVCPPRQKRRRKTRRRQAEKMATEPLTRMSTSLREVGEIAFMVPSAAWIDDVGASVLGMLGAWRNESGPRGGNLGGFGGEIGVGRAHENEKQLREERKKAKKKLKKPKRTASAEAEKVAGPVVRAAWVAWAGQLVPKHECTCRTRRLDRSLPVQRPAASSTGVRSPARRVSPRKPCRRAT